MRNLFAAARLEGTILPYLFPYLSCVSGIVTLDAYVGFQTSRGSVRRWRSLMTSDTAFGLTLHSNWADLNCLYWQTAGRREVGEVGADRGDQGDELPVPILSCAKEFPPPHSTAGDNSLRGARESNLESFLVKIINI